MARTTSASTLVRNTLANGAGASVGMAIGILITPFTITQLGLSAYGVWSLALTLSFAGGYAAMSDLGIEAATVRYVAEAEGDDDLAGINRTVATTLVFFAIVGGLLAIGMVALASSLSSLFDAPPGLVHASTIAFALIGGQLVIEMPSRALTAVLEGTQNFVAYQAVELSKALSFAVLTIIVLLTDHGIIGLGVSYVATSLGAFFAYWFLAHRAVTGLRVWPGNASRSELRRLLSYGSSVFVFRLTGTAYRQMDRLILGVATEPRLVAIYEIANKVHLAAALVQSMSVSALVPAVAKARNDLALLRDMLLRGTSYSVAASLPFTTAAIVFAGPLLRDWIGPEANGAITSAQLFLVYLTFAVFHMVSTTMLVALGNVRPILLTNIGMLTVNVAVSLVLVGPLEVEGVLLGTLVATIVGWVPLLVIALRRFEVDATDWVRRIVVPQILPTGSQVAVLFVGLWLLDDVGSLILDGLWILLSVGTYLAIFVRLSLPEPERRALASTLRRAIRRGAPHDPPTTPPPGDSAAQANPTAAAGPDITPR
ncbi:oligosaccharide flippase family protein [Patulibacter sp.]|uniref:oligosaccharide flippase family protein n=1 Tax=Patulibacter sp. TaxID=1912859 RepID=UPI002718FDD6|nr:oligosaccharide flippase family protein [Patulibacter sp.]MDO9408810.1 oligosaccharide flippase family protein [Patulibacter sp.]